MSAYYNPFSGRLNKFSLRLQEIIKVTSITNLTIKINLCGRMLKDNFNFNYYDHSDYNNKFK